MKAPILIVDDDRAMVHSLCDVLALGGWSAAAAFSGEEAVARVAEESFGAVLMDVRMGGINGVEAMKQMTRLRPGISVVLMTAYTRSELIAEARRSGAIDVLSKPVPPPLLFEVLEQIAPRNGGRGRA